MTPDHEQQERLIAELLHWVWSCRLQVQRLIESTRLELSGNEPVPSAVLGQRCSRASYDEHLVLVAGKHVLAAAELATTAWREFLIDPTLGEQIRLLRNIYEHWDDRIKGKPLRSLETFDRKFPDGRAWSITYAPDGWLIGGVISIPELMKVLDRLEAAALPMSIYRDKGNI